MRDEISSIEFPFSVFDINERIATMGLHPYKGRHPDVTEGIWSVGDLPPSKYTFEAPFRVPDPSPRAGGGWVAVMATETHGSPFGGPAANMDFGPLQILWINGRGEWGFSAHRTSDYKTSLYWMDASLAKLRAHIRPVRDIPGFQMPKEPLFSNLLASNEKKGWPLERLVALARGEVEVRNDAMQFWTEEGVPPTW
ncbi:MAG: hypothetical protein N2313_10410 [Meiothermus ruber]|jgi:hypothetical protein|nr:hypothetical protein [Meiothermus ruber]